MTLLVVVGAEQTHTKSVLDASRYERSVRKGRKVNKISSPVNNWITTSNPKYKSKTMKQRSSKIYHNKEEMPHIYQLVLISPRATEEEGESIAISINFLLHFLPSLFTFLPSALHTTSQIMREPSLSLKHKRAWSFSCSLYAELSK